MIMGNCLRKKTQDPKQQKQPEPAHPPTGVDAIRNSRSKKISTSSAQQQTLSCLSKSSKARHCKYEQCGASSQERTRHVPISNSRRGMKTTEFHRILVYEYMCKGSLDAHLLNGKAQHRTFCAIDKYRRDVHLYELNTLEQFAGHLALKSDVYSFGVVLLEIFSGCVAVKRYANGTTMDLAIWAKPHPSNQMELLNIIDKRISRNIEMEEAYKFASIIRQCLSSDPKDRPTMAEILANLEQLHQELLLYNLNTLGLSKYHRREHIL